jgi:hypothetical protein
MFGIIGKWNILGSACFLSTAVTSKDLMGNAGMICDGEHGCGSAAY